MQFDTYDDIKHKRIIRSMPNIIHVVLFKKFNVVFRTYSGSDLECTEIVWKLIFIKISTNKNISVANSELKKIYWQNKVYLAPENIKNDLVRICFWPTRNSVFVVTLVLHISFFSIKIVQTFKKLRRQERKNTQMILLYKIIYFEHYVEEGGAPKPPPLGGAPRPRPIPLYPPR